MPNIVNLHFSSQLLKTQSKKTMYKQMALKVQHFKKDCISCGACAAISPEFWEMDDEGLAQLKGSKNIAQGQDPNNPDEHWELEISEDQKEPNQEASDVCPVQIIHVKNE